MAAIAIKIMHQKEQVRKQPETAAAPTTVAPFRPLDPDAVNETIRRSSSAATSRASGSRATSTDESAASSCSKAPQCRLRERTAGAAGCATVHLSESFELDLENRGNPLFVQLASLIRLARRPRQRLAALIGKLTEPVNRWTKDF